MICNMGNYLDDLVVAVVRIDRNGMGMYSLECISKDTLRTLNVFY